MKCLDLSLLFFGLFHVNVDNGYRISYNIIIINIMTRAVSFLILSDLARRLNGRLSPQILPSFLFDPASCVIRTDVVYSTHYMPAFLSTIMRILITRPLIIFISILIDSRINQLLGRSFLVADPTALQQ